MTVIGAGGIHFAAYEYSVQFKRQYKKLGHEIKSQVRSTLMGLCQQPRPPGICFEKLKGYANPNIYTVHVTGNFKISIEAKTVTIANGKVQTWALLRKVGTHNEIDRAP